LAILGLLVLTFFGDDGSLISLFFSCFLLPFSGTGVFLDEKDFGFLVFKDLNFISLFMIPISVPD